MRSTAPGAAKPVQQLAATNTNCIFNKDAVFKLKFIQKRGKNDQLEQTSNGKGVLDNLAVACSHVLQSLSWVRLEPMVWKEVPPHRVPPAEVQVARMMKLGQPEKR